MFTQSPAPESKLHGWSPAPLPPRGRPQRASVFLSGSGDDSSPGPAPGPTLRPWDWLARGSPPTPRARGGAEPLPPAGPQPGNAARRRRLGWPGQRQSDGECDQWAAAAVRRKSRLASRGGGAALGVAGRGAGAGCGRPLLGLRCGEEDAEEAPSRAALRGSRPCRRGAHGQDHQPAGECAAAARARRPVTPPSAAVAGARRGGPRSRGPGGASPAASGWAGDRGRRGGAAWLLQEALARVRRALARRGR